MGFLRKSHISLLIGLIAVIAFAYLGIASLIADTGYPGGMSPKAANFNYAVTAFILSLTGWETVWRKEMYVQESQKLIKGRSAVIFGAVIAILFSLVGIWFLVQAIVA